MESIQVPVVTDVASIDWPRIELFRKRFAILWDNFKDLELGQLHGSFSRQDKTMEVMKVVLIYPMSTGLRAFTLTSDIST